MSPVFKISHLSKDYPNGIRALQDINCEVREGEFLVVIGLSGSGKSTLLRCMNRLIAPTSGEIYFQDRLINSLGRREIQNLRRNVAMIFQHFNLVPRRSVMSNVLAGALGRTSTLKGILEIHSEIERREAMQCLHSVGLESSSRLRADQMSGGQQQRVAIARALFQRPKVLLADEPVASLDPATCHTVMDYLRKLNQEMGITVVCSLHFLSLVREYASRVIALRAGELVYEGGPEHIDENWFRRIYGENARDFAAGDGHAP